MHYGDIIRILAEERNLTQKQLSADLNIAASTLGNYIRNLREPDYATLKRIASYFGVTTDYLLDYRAGQTQSGLEPELLRVFRALRPDQQELYIEQGKAFLIQNVKKEKSSPSESHIQSKKSG